MNRCWCWLFDRIFAIIEFGGEKLKSWSDLFAFNFRMNLIVYLTIYMIVFLPPFVPLSHSLNLRSLLANMTNECHLEKFRIGYESAVHWLRERHDTITWNLCFSMPLLRNVTIAFVLAKNQWLLCALNTTIEILNLLVHSYNLVSLCASPHKLKSNTLIDRRIHELLLLLLP